MNTAYELGKRAHKAGAECEPFTDTIFWNYMTSGDLPVVPTIADYVSGYHDARDAKNKKAQERRDNFRVIK